MEKYITFSAGKIHFIDSLNFIVRDLEQLVEFSSSFPITARHSRGSDLLYRKGIFPYKYMNVWERFEETSLPGKEKFYRKLNDEHVSDEEYEHAKKVWETMKWVPTARTLRAVVSPTPNERETTALRALTI